MKDTKFEELTSLVLVDILAALPMAHVLRMARLGHERLRQTCSLKWVTDRMSDVIFGTIVKAHQVGGDAAATFCSKSLMKRLKGRVVITGYDCKQARFMDACVKLVKQVPGLLHLCHMSPKTPTCLLLESCRTCKKFGVAMKKQNNLTYSSVTSDEDFDYVLIDESPALVFDYEYTLDKEYHFVLYRPALLNGRHIIDILRAVCGPTDVDEAELGRVRREATERARDVSEMGEGWEGVWKTWWWGAAITAEAGAVETGSDCCV